MNVQTIEGVSHHFDFKTWKAAMRRRYKVVTILPLVTPVDEELQQFRIDDRPHWGTANPAIGDRVAIGDVRHGFRIFRVIGITQDLFADTVGDCKLTYTFDGYIWAKYPGGAIYRRQPKERGI